MSLSERITDALAAHPKTFVVVAFIVGFVAHAVVSSFL